MNRFFSILLQIQGKYSLYKQRYKSRKLLLKLDDDRLNDLGLSKEEALKEGNLPFWMSDVDNHSCKQENKIISAKTDEASKDRHVINI